MPNVFIRTNGSIRSQNFIFQSVRYLRCLDSGRKYHHSGGQFAIRNDSAILCFDIIEEADDYYFPPLTGTYLRLSRTVIFPDSFLTPLWLLFMQNPGWIPEWLAFIRVTDDPCGADLSAPDPGICHRWSGARGSQHPQHADDTAHVIAGIVPLGNTRSNPAAGSTARRCSIWRSSRSPTTR